MIIWVIWWLFDWIFDWLFDDYLWLFVWVLDYLQIIWLIIWWLFFRILDYLMIIWCLFDDYSNYLMIICHFVQAHCSAHSSATAISLSCWACLHCGLQTIGNLKPCRGACFATAGQSAWSLAMNSNQRLGGTLCSCLLQKACCGSYLQKWENGQPRNIVCWTSSEFIICSLALPKALSTTPRKDA